MSFSTDTDQSIYMEATRYNDYTMTTATGTSGTLRVASSDMENTVYDDNRENRIYHPALYFKFVKSKLTKIQQEKLKKRLNMLKKLIPQTKSLGQQGLYEELAKQLAVVVKESEALACGVNYKVPRDDIEKIMHKVRGMDIKFDKLENFPRVIPDKIRRKIKQIQKVGLFDNLWILYTTKPDEKKIKSNKEKIKEKDPILFGEFSFHEDVFYFIADWIDEYCDLTIDKFVDIIKEDDKDYALEKIPEMDENLIQDVIEEVKRKQKRLANTTASNYRDNMAKEDKENKWSEWRKWLKK